MKIQEYATFDFSNKLSYKKGCVFGNLKSSEENLYVDFQLVALTFTFRSSDDSDLVEEVESG